MNPSQTTEHGAATSFTPGCPECGGRVFDLSRSSYADRLKCENGHALIQVFDLEPDDEVGCYFCMDDGVHTVYRFGEAVLAGADHTPWDGNANYVCLDHLDRDVVVLRQGVLGTPHARPLGAERDSPSGTHCER